MSDSRRWRAWLGWAMLALLGALAGACQSVVTPIQLPGAEGGALPEVDSAGRIPDAAAWRTDVSSSPQIPDGGKPGADAVVKAGDARLDGGSFDAILVGDGPKTDKKGDGPQPKLDKQARPGDQIHSIMF
jgi:hypothetical protein